MSTQAGLRGKGRLNACWLPLELLGLKVIQQAADILAAVNDSLILDKELFLASYREAQILLGKS